MSLFSGLFTSDVINKSVDAIIDSGDALIYTEEEKARAEQLRRDTKLKMLPLFEPFKLAQRYIAFWYSFLFGISFLSGLGMVMFNVVHKFNALADGVKAENIVQLDLKPLLNLVQGFSIGYIALAIVTWYFSGGVISSFKGGKSEK